MTRPRIVRDAFGRLPDGRAVEQVTLSSAAGVRVQVITFGGIIRTLHAPARDGSTDDVVLGFDDLDAYLENEPYFGAVIGRFANRIARGRFTLDGRTYALATNNGPNHLHGGAEGFDKKLWDAEMLPEQNAVSLTRTSPDGEEGYPGTLRARVTYTLSSAGELRVDYEAESDAPTPLNLTQHTYFNLRGHASGDVLAHVLTLNGERFTPTDDTQIPTGEIASVVGTPFDFREPAAIGARLEEDHPQLRVAGGYDHNWVLAGAGETAPAARVHDPLTGRSLDVLTDAPGVQFYTGNLLDGILGKAGARYERHAGFCLETQQFPDAPNQPAFPSAILRPGEVWRSRTIFRFSVSGR